MKFITLITTSLAVIAALHSAPARAVDYDDSKAWSGSMCTPYTSAAPDYSKLKFRATGVTNEGTSYVYVICALPLDAEDGWFGGPQDAYGYVQLDFRSNTEGVDQCTLTVGTTAEGTTYTNTKSVTGIVGSTVTINLETPFGAGFSSAQPPTVVCRLAPKHTLSLVRMTEYSVQTDGYVYEPPL